AGRFARRLKAWGNANGVPVIYCKAGERKHLIAEEYLAAHEVGTGVFLVLAAKAPASVWQVSRSESSGLIGNIAKKTAYVNHYSFHIMDPDWGHVTIKMSGHPPFPAQVILNGHEYVAAAARAAGIGFAKEGNCFTGIADPRGLARIADTLSRGAAIGRLGQVCDRWIYSACLCFGLDLADQARSGLLDPAASCVPRTSTVSGCRFCPFWKGLRPVAWRHFPCVPSNCPFTYHVVMALEDLWHAKPERLATRSRVPVSYRCRLFIALACGTYVARRAPVRTALRRPRLRLSVNRQA
ncbi:MAG TPA: hypothetical protein VII41_11930, partial [Steroidobacteraceae bacterium]